MDSPPSCLHQKGTGRYKRGDKLEEWNQRETSIDAFSPCLGNYRYKLWSRMIGGEANMNCKNIP